MAVCRSADDADDAGVGAGGKCVRLAGVDPAGGGGGGWGNLPCATTPPTVGVGVDTAAAGAAGLPPGGGGRCVIGEGGGIIAVDRSSPRDAREFISAMEDR